MTTTYTANISLIQPGVGDAATTNAWGGLLNTCMALIDSAVAGQLVLSVAGNSNVVLSFSAGVADQERNQDFIFTGALTGNINVLWPQGQQRMVSVFNETSGNFTLSVGVNNGSGLPAGSTVAVPQGYRVGVVLDGTNASWRTISIVPSTGAISTGAIVASTINGLAITNNASASLSIASGAALFVGNATNGTVTLDVQQGVIPSPTSGTVYSVYTIPNTSSSDGIWLLYGGWGTGHAAVAIITVLGGAIATPSPVILAPDVGGFMGFSISGNTIKMSQSTGGVQASLSWLVFHLG